jgi:ribosomal protein S18 acetylase RimI-like enzyme
METRRLTFNDIPIVEEILKNLIDIADRGKPFPSMSHWKSLFNNPACYLIAALESGKSLGFALAYRFPSLYAEEEMAYLYDIEVLEAERKKGIGRQLITHLLEELKKDGTKSMWLGTEMDNIPAQQLYASTGAEKTGEIFYDYTYYLD